MHPSFCASDTINGPAAGGLLDAGCTERADARIAAFVVTHLNLSDLHRDAEPTEDAAAHRCVAHCRPMALLRDPPPGVTLR